MLSTTALTIACSLLVAFCYLKYRESIKHDSREPPLLRGWVPYVSHLVGILTSGSRHFKRLGQHAPKGIFTLPMPGSRLYIVTDPGLAASVQIASKSLSFSPLVPPILQRVAGFDTTTLDLIKGDMEHGYVQTVQKAQHSRLRQGQYLDDITLKACTEILRRLESFGIEVSNKPKSISVLPWVKHVVTMATATFFYGPNNPVERDPRLAKRFWDFDAGIPGLLLGVLPSLTARRAYLGREAMVKALAQYIESPQYAEAAAITRERSDIGRSFGVDTDNVARSDLTFFFAGIVNTSLTAFWMLVNIFARPQLTAAVRAELESVIVTPSDQPQSAVLSIKSIVQSCPLLYAVFREVLRLYSDNFATRFVLTDTLLANSHFLKQGSIVQISGGIIHGDDSIWGEDVASFRPERHLDRPIDRSDPKRAAKVHPAAFRAFGGGETLCPGRHFATNEIIALVAMVVLLFDVTGPGGSEIRIPAKDDSVLPIHVLEPLKEVQVDIQKRKGWQAVSLVLQK